MSMSARRPPDDPITRIFFALFASFAVKLLRSADLAPRSSKVANLAIVCRILSEKA